LEKLSLLEEKLNRLIEQHIRLKEEKNVLESSLDEKSRRLNDLMGQVEELRQERDVIRKKLSRMAEMLRRLEYLEADVTGGK
jgi:chromosome segregation ATPase